MKKKEKSKKSKLIKILIIAVAVVLVLGYGGYTLYKKVIVPNKIYNNTIEMYNSGKQIKAIEKLKTMNYKDSNELYLKYSEEYGDILANGFLDCETAITYYKQAGLTEESKKITNCQTYINNKSNMEQAETYYKEGSLRKAKEIYEKLDANFELNGVKVSDRLSTLEEYKKFVDFSGEYYGSNGKMHVKEIWRYNGSWDGWDSTYSGYCTVKCIINDDETVKISVNATFYTFTNYSSINSLLKTDDATAYYTKTIKKTDKLPTSYGKYATMVAASGATGKASLKYSNKKFVLSFSLNDKEYSQNFSRKYTSKITYSHK